MSVVQNVWDSYMGRELMDQMAGRISRVRPGLVTFFAPVNDRFMDLQALQQHLSGPRPSANIESILQKSMEHMATFQTLLLSLV